MRQGMSIPSIHFAGQSDRSTAGSTSIEALLADVGLSSGLTCGPRETGILNLTRTEIFS